MRVRRNAGVLPRVVVGHAIPSQPAACPDLFLAAIDRLIREIDRAGG
jgi:hypothetical protein